MGDYIKEIIDKVNFSDKEPHKIYDFYKNHLKWLSTDNFEIENLRETSNMHHNAVYDYLDKYGADNNFALHLKIVHEWIEMIAEKNKIEL